MAEDLWPRVSCLGTRIVFTPSDESIACINPDTELFDGANFVLVDPGVRPMPLVLPSRTVRVHHCIRHHAQADYGNSARSNASPMAL